METRDEHDDMTSHWLYSETSNEHDEMTTGFTAREETSRQCSMEASTATEAKLTKGSLAARNMLFRFPATCASGAADWRTWSTKPSPIRPTRQTTHTVRGGGSRFRCDSTRLSLFQFLATFTTYIHTHTHTLSLSFKQPRDHSRPRISSTLSSITNSSHSK